MDLGPPRFWGEGCGLSLIMVRVGLDTPAKGRGQKRESKDKGRIKTHAYKEGHERPNENTDLKAIITINHSYLRLAIQNLEHPKFH